MAARKYMGDQPGGTWGLMGINATTSPKALQISDTPRAQVQQEQYPTLASRNPSGIGIKRSTAHEHVYVTDTAQSPLKKVKLEDTSEGLYKAPKSSGFVDLTGDSSDDEIDVKTTKQAMPHPLAKHGAEFGHMRSQPSCAKEDKMMGIVRTSALLPQAKVASQPFSFSESPTDDDSKPFIDETPKAPVKQVIKIGPFNCDDSDDSDDESTPAPASARPMTIPRRSSPTPHHSHVQDQKVAEAKAAQLKHAAELRSIAEAKKAARIAEGTRDATQLPADSKVQRPTPCLASEPMATPSRQTPLSPAKKRLGASAFVAGRKLEPGRPSKAMGNTSLTSENRRTEEQKARDHSLSGTLSASAADYAALASSVTTNLTQTAMTSQVGGKQPISSLQKAFNIKNGASTMASTKFAAPISPPAKHKNTKTVSFNIPEEDASFTQQPSMAANAARSHVEKLRRMPSSLASTSKRTGSDGLSQAQNAELFGEDDSDIEEVVVVAATKPKHVINLAAEEDSVDRAANQDAMHKAALAHELSKAQKEEVRAAEQRRRIEAGREEKLRRAEEAAEKKKREEEEHSRRVTKLRLDRIAEEERLVEERRVTHAKLQENIMRKQREDQELKRKALEVRKAQTSRLNEQQEREKQERVRKKTEANARMHASAAAEAEPEADVQRCEDSGELILEGQPTPSRDLQVSQDVSAAQMGQALKTQTGPFSLNSVQGATSLLQNISQSNAPKPTTIDERIAQQKQEWATSRDLSANRGMFNAPARKSIGQHSSLFTSPPARAAARDRGSSSAAPETAAGRKARSGHERKLGTVSAEDAKLVQWRDQDNMEWKQIVAEYPGLSGKKLSEGTLRKRYRQVRVAVDDAKVPFSQMRLLANGDDDAHEQVNSILEAAYTDPSTPKGPVNLPALGGGGPVRLAPLSQHPTSSPLWQNPTFDFEEEEAVVVKPRSALETLAAAKTSPVPEERPTTGGKCMKAVFALIGRHLLGADDEDSHPQVEYESSVDEEEEEEEEEDDPCQGWKAEDFQPYGFQVQRRELSIEGAKTGFPIDNQEWMPCGDIFTNCREANTAALAEVTTIVPGGAFYADPENDPCLRYEYIKSSRLDEKFMFCQLTNSAHGMVQTTVDKIIRAPRARMQPPTRREMREELNAREIWFIRQQITIQPPAVPYDPLFDASPSEPRTETKGESDPYTDYDLATKRAVQIFVDKMYKSELQSLDSRSEEKRELVEGYLAGILADRTFEGEMVISEAMEGMSGIRKEFKVEEGSKVTLGIWIEKGRLKGPLN